MTGHNIFSVLFAGFGVCFGFGAGFSFSGVSVGAYGEPGLTGQGIVSG